MPIAATPEEMENATEIVLDEDNSGYLFGCAESEAFARKLRAVFGTEEVHVYWSPDEEVWYDEHPLPGDEIDHPKPWAPDRGCWVVYMTPETSVAWHDQHTGVMVFSTGKRLAPVYKVNGVQSFGRHYGLDDGIIDDLRFSDMKRHGDVVASLKRKAHRDAYEREWRRQSSVAGSLAGDKFIQKKISAAAGEYIRPMDREERRQSAKVSERKHTQRLFRREYDLKEMGL